MMLWRPGATEHERQLIVIAVLIGQPQGATCLTTGHAGRSEREDLTLICRETAARVASLLGAPVNRVAIEVEDDAYALDVSFRDSGYVLRWPSRALWTAAWRGWGLEEDTRQLNEWRDILLRHELAHVMSNATIYDGPIRTPAHSYGTALPDWLDEALAIWGESDAGRNRRIERLKELDLDSIPDLTAILTARHPKEGDSMPSPITRTVTRTVRRWVPGSAVEDSIVITTRIRYRIAADAHVTVDTIRMEDFKPASVIDGYFYPLSYAALWYLREVGGEGIISSIIARSRDGVEGHDYVLGLPGVPSRPAALNADWRRWLERILTSH